MGVAPPSAKSRSTIWQLANQERRVAMVLLQKKQRHAVERWRYDRAAGLITEVPAATGMGVRENGRCQLKFARVNELLYVLQKKRDAGRR
jgi:hypothetical protein